MENNNGQYTRIRVYLPVLLALVLMAGFYIGTTMQRNRSGKQTRFFNVGIERSDKISNILSFILDSYVDTIDREALTEEAIHALLKGLDPHSAFIPARAFREMNDPLMGSFEGIGIEFNMMSDTVVVISPIAGGPSEKAGLMAGDRIISVEGEPIAGVRMSTDEVVSRLKGKKGTEVRVEILRSGVGETMHFTLVRDKIPSYSLDIAYMADPETGYIRLNKFSATTHAEFLRGLEKLRTEGMQRLILDLRGNGGGFLEAAIALADELLDAGKLIVYTDGRARPRTYAYARKNGAFETQPLVILIDEWSASASEIVAGAVQDNDRGLILGRRSFGKGLVQEQVQLPDGSALRLTVARYYTPTGRSIQKPYENGQDAYYADFMQRFIDGELESEENMHFTDSLRFETPGGRIVYGGGGIMPDVFVPIETGEHFVLYNQLANRGLIYRFAFDHADRNRNVLSRQGDARSFVSNYTVNDALFREFLSFTQNQGFVLPAIIHPLSEQLIKNHLKALIGRNIFGEEAYFPVLNQTDPGFLQAMQLLKNPVLFSARLSGQ